MYSNQHIDAQNNVKPVGQFFGNGFHNKPFFSPVLQLKPAEEPTTETPKNTSMDIAEWNKLFKEAKQNICTLQHEIFKLALNTASKINSKTAEVLDVFSSVAATCSSISDYVKLKPKQIKDTGVYKTYQHGYIDDYTGSREGRERFDANPWHQAVKKGTNAVTREEINSVGGFYQRANDTINLPQDATVGSALHESMHRMSGARFRAVTRKANDPDFLSEGATQYFTDKVLQDIGLPKMRGHNYGKHVAAIENLVSRMNGDFRPLARLYFMDDMVAFHEILFHLHLARDMKEMIANPGQQIFDLVTTP